MRRLRESEEGWALVTAVTVMAAMLLAGAVSLRAVDFSSRQTRVQRERESALNLTEGVLSAQTFALARQWPGPNRPAYPSTCTSATVTAGQCPNRQTLAAATSTAPTGASFRGVDFDADATWTTRVRDNYGALAASYATATADGALTGALGTCAAPCSRDFNNDGALWVQARAMVHGEARNLVALMKLEQLSEAVPQTGLTAGAMKITNNGNKPMVDATGSQVVVRCTPDSLLGNGAVCSNYRGTQVFPLPIQALAGNLMDAAQIARFRDRAIVDGTYFAGCPPDTLTGRVVFVENCQSPPNYSGGGAVSCTPPAGMTASCINTIDLPGVLIVHCGALRLTGSWTYVGLMYFVNGSDGSCAAGQVRGTTPPTCASNSLDANTVLDTQGGFGTWGGVAADGNACVLLGSNGMQLHFDANAFASVASYGTVGLVQNTWRELPAGTG